MGEGKNPFCYGWIQNSAFLYTHFNKKKIRKGARNVVVRADSMASCL